MSKLIFGCGYLGKRVARLWRASGDEVTIVTRSADRAAEFARHGFRPLVADVTDKNSLTALPAADTVLYAIGHDRAAAPSMRQVYVEGLHSALDALVGRIERFIYISSTSVYGQTGGVWVDEDSLCKPRGENGAICLEAEQTLLNHPLADRAVRLRLAGIYGPGRIPRRAALLAGEPIAAPSRGYLNLVHVDDAAQIVLAAERGPCPALYAVSDGQPAQRHEYYAELARLVGGPAPRFVDPPPESAARARAESDKRINNRRLMNELSVTLRYPSYREGLAAIIEQEKLEENQ